MYRSNRFRSISVEKTLLKSGLSCFYASLKKFFQAYDKRVFSVKNCSLQGSKLQFGQRKTIVWTRENYNPMTTANSLAVLVFVIVFVASSANIKLCFKIAC